MRCVVLVAVLALVAAPARGAGVVDGWELLDALVPAQAATLFTSAAASARGRERAEALCGLAVADAVLGQRRAAMDAYDAAAASFPSPRGPHDAALLELAGAQVDVARERNIPALGAAVRAHAVARASGSPALVARCALLVGKLMPSAERRRHLLAAVDSADAAERPLLAARARFELGLHEMGFGTLERALEAFTPAAESLDDAAPGRLLYELRRHEGRCRRLLDRPAAALRSLACALDAAERLGDSLAVAEAAADLAEVCRERNMAAQAREFIVTARSAAAGVGDEASAAVRKRLDAVEQALPPSP